MTTGIYTKFYVVFCKILCYNVNVCNVVLYTLKQLRWRWVMRVIAGIAKGHKLVAPEGLDTRPTTDRIKETMFNIISSNINK